MKIKSWVRGIHIVMVVTVLLTSIAGLFILREQSEVREELLSSRIKDRLNVYDKVLSDGRIYNVAYDFEGLFNEEGIDVEVFSSNGIQLYSTKPLKGNVQALGSSEFYKDLYKIKFNEGKPTITKLALINGKVTGMYKITLTGDEDNLIYISHFNIACTILAVTTLISLVFISRIIKTKMTRPINNLSNAMTGFAKGQNVEVDIQGNNEISMLSKVFCSMKDEITQQQQVIEEEKKAREYMVATISHDLKSPLTSIRVYSELLSNEKEDVDKLTKVIMDKCDYMNEMIEDLLEYSVLTTNDVMDVVSVEGDEFFNMIFDGCDDLCNKKNILYESSILCSGEYNVNVKEMMRAIDNLISNAITYTKEGNKIWTGVYSSEYDLPPWVDCEFRKEISNMKSNGLVVIIKNQGDYINSEKIEQIFDPFYKCEGGKSSKGTGLGLSIVKLIVEKHNGQIKLYSKEDSGNIFVFNLNRLS